MVDHPHILTLERRAATAAVARIRTTGIGLAHRAASVRDNSGMAGPGQLC
ncbi:MAG: hypothetical protein IVW52_15850 [Acidimicrobiales bacterium]|nr:hypothetical protein [Acidimicrobiales bacterium]